MMTEIWVDIGSGNGLLPDGTKPFKHLNQRWLIINEVLSHSPESSFTTNAQNTILYNEFWKSYFEIIATFFQNTVR